MTASTRAPLADLLTTVPVTELQVGDLLFESFSEDNEPRLGRVVAPAPDYYPADRVTFDVERADGFVQRKGWPRQERFTVQRVDLARLEAALQA